MFSRFCAAVSYLSALALIWLVILGVPLNGQVFGFWVFFLVAAGLLAIPNVPDPAVRRGDREGRQ